METIFPGMIIVLILLSIFPPGDHRSSAAS